MISPSTLVGMLLSVAMGKRINHSGARTLLGMAMYIQKDAQTIAIDVARDASAHELYQAMYEQFGNAPKLVLSHGGRDIAEDDVTPASDLASDLSISAESTLHARLLLTDAEKISRVFRDVSGKENLLFWDDCQRCIDQPQLQICSNLAQWDGVLAYDTEEIQRFPYCTVRRHSHIVTYYMTSTLSFQYSQSVPFVLTNGRRGQFRE